jgi:hypothetical protein
MNAFLPADWPYAIPPVARAKAHQNRLKIQLNVMTALWYPFSDLGINAFGLSLKSAIRARFSAVSKLEAACLGSIASNYIAHTLRNESGQESQCFGTGNA